MLFIVIETFRTSGAVDVYRRARDQGRMLPDGVRYVSSWVDLDFTRAYQLMEAPSAKDLDPWIAKWSDIVDFEIIPVRTSAEATALIGPTLDAVSAPSDDQTYDVVVRNVQPRTLAVVRQRVAVANVASDVPMLFGKVYALAKMLEVTLDGQNVAVYHGVGLEVEVEAGAGVIGRFESNADLHLAKTPAGSAATTTHRGDYAGLPNAHKAIDDWCKANERSLAGVRWELYGHWVGDPEKRRTEVYHLLA